MALIEVTNLVKDFTIVKKGTGLAAALKSVVKADKHTFRAVDDVSFQIGRGEIVGYIGPNGAGKSTTIKMMSGILQPTSGSVMIGGISPFAKRKQVVHQLGVVFGQRSQLFWHLRLGESFELLRRIYQLDDDRYQSSMAMLDDIFHISELLDIPVRQLSLGQRMRGDLAAAVLHNPPILFLDEPTIGLDVEVKYAVRKFIKDINKRCGTTIILTTHDLDDIEQLCSRLMIINHGKIIEDSSLDDLMDRLAPVKRVIIDLFEAPETPVQLQNAVVVKSEQARLWIEYEKSKTCAGDVISQISAHRHIRDISFDETGIEDIIRRVYAE